MASISSGPPGVEVPHIWDPDGINLTINTISSRPRVKIDEITGWYSLARAEDNRTDRTGRRGTQEYRSMAREKDLVYSGSVQGRSLDEVVVAMTTLRNSFRDRSQSKNMVMDGDPQWFYQARVTAFDGDSKHAEYDPTRFLPWQIPFILGLRMSDGRYYVLPLASGGPHADGDDEVYTNSGGAEADPVFEVTVLADDTDVEFIDLTRGLLLKFNDVPSGDMVVDFRFNVATIDGLDATRYMDDLNSDWWDEGVEGMVPGASTFKVNGGAWSIFYYHASE